MLMWTNDRWSTVCGDGWTHKLALDVCRHLGKPHGWPFLRLKMSIFISMLLQKIN